MGESMAISFECIRVGDLSHPDLFSGILPSEHGEFLFRWEGVNPTPPESWLLPSFLPFHPSRWWVHSRQVYIPMSYLAGRKAKAELDPLLKSLRKELYTQPYEDIDWPSCRSLISETDLHSPHHPALKCAFIILAYWEKICPQRLREMGLVTFFLH
jgi:lanosterol synthase